MKRDLKLNLNTDVVKDFALDVWEDLDRTRTRAVAIGLGLALLAITLLAVRPQGSPEAKDSFAAPKAAPTEEIAFAVPGEKPMRMRDLDLAAPRDPFKTIGEIESPSSPTTGPDQIVTASSSGGAPVPSSYGGADPLMPIGSLGGGGPTTPPTGGTDGPPTADPRGEFPVVEPDDEAPRTDYSYAADLQFGPRGGLARYANVQRLGLIPSRKEPYLMYLGVRPDRKTAVFMIDSRLSQGGEGRCVPKPAQCTFLEMQARAERDEHNFRDAEGNEYLLRLRRLFRTTASVGSVGARDVGNLPGTPPLLDGER